MEKNPRGRPRLKFISQIIDDQGCNSYQELKRKANDRNMEVAANQSLD